MSRFESIWPSAERGLSTSILFKAALSVLAGAILAALGPLPGDDRLALILFGSALTLLALIAAAGPRRSWTWACVYITAVLFGAYRHQAGALQIERSTLDLHGPVKQQWVQVADDPLLKTSVDIEWMNGAQAGRRARMFTIQDFPHMTYGRAVKISGWASGGKIYLTALHEQSDATLTPFQQLRSRVLNVRDRLLDQVRRQAPPEYQGFVFSTLFGKRARLSGHSARLLEENGLSHVLALSGLHTAILAGMLLWLLRPFSPRVSVPVTALFLGAFVLAVGASPSVVRASLMTLMGLAGHALARRVRILPILAAAFLIEFTFFPHHLSSPGFQLSYLATLALGFAQILFHYGSGAQPVLRALMPLILIQVFILPLSVHYFQRWSWVSIVSNLLFLPVLAFLIGFNALSLSAGLFSESLGRALFAASHAAYHFTESALSAVPGLFSVHSNMGEVPVEWVWIFFALWSLYLLSVPKRAVWWSAGALIFIGGWVHAQDRLAAQRPDSVVLTGGPVSGAYAVQGRRVDGLWIDDAGDSSITPLVKRLLRLGVRDIESARAPAAALERLAREFRLAPSALDHRVRQYGRSWTWDIRPDLHLMHLTSQSPPGEISNASRDGAHRVLIYSADPDGRVVYPLSVSAASPDVIYVTGGAGLAARSRLVRTLSEISDAEILFAAVDGDVIWVRDSGGWIRRTELDEEMR